MQLIDLAFQTLLFIGLRSVVNLSMTTSVFLFDTARVFKKDPNLFPNNFFQNIGSQLLIITNTLPSETIRVRARAAIINILFRLPLRRRSGHRLAIIGVTTVPANHQALE